MLALRIGNYQFKNFISRKDAKTQRRKDVKGLGDVLIYRSMAIKLV
jgi:hypothetical protein